MKLTDDDYRMVIGEAALKTVSQTSPEIRHNAEAAAAEEIASYLRPDYDCAAIFADDGPLRSDRLLMMRVADIALYHMVASTPQKMGYEIRKERYERAIKWLEGVQAGRIVPDLPRSSGAAGGCEGSPSGSVFFSEPKLRHNW